MSIHSSSINFTDECSVCGKYFSPKIEYDNQYKLFNIVNKHQECMAVTKNIMAIKEQIKELEKKLVDEEFTLFCIRMSKHNVDT